MSERGASNLKPAEGEQRQVKIGVDDRKMSVNYANFFRANAMADEVLVDFGITEANPAVGQQNQPDMIVRLNRRMVLNYYAAKRLALTLGDVIRRHEEQFGVLELDVAKRQKK